ncbi:ROK family protein [Maribellus comscasis]|uniref:ROK family protein n=1 Tax=Maribellus comscasis TaxID=2681766 RepID=A0A6I6K393_9BACT|nr:ROK family protein [Maribellus comscasis]QGY47017.1 ROK family protein [Maribellus comscasis]
MNKSTDEYYIGLDIGGTKCAIVIGDKNFNILQKIRFDTETERGYTAILDEFHYHIDKLFVDYPKENLRRIGISCGGPLDSKEGVIYSPPNLPGWDRVPIVEVFNKKYGVPVALQNDANACALAEWLMGAGKGTQNMIFLTFGTGMGSGLILNGQLYTGTNDLGGEVGHIRLANTGPVGFGKAGSFEGFCSGGGIAQLAKTVVTERLGRGESVEFCPNIEMAGELTAKDVAMAARIDDPVAKEIVRISAEYLGRGLAVLIDIINPQCIVIGSIYARNEMLFKPHVDRVLKEEAIPAAIEVCKIKPALLGESLGDFAALGVAIYENEF